MKTEKITFQSSDKEHTIKAHLYLPEREPSAVLQISYGMNEFKERYEEFAEFLTNHGVAVAIGDHLGHGESVNSPDEYGYFGETNGARFLVEDEHLLLKRIKEKYPDLPYFLLGHSMGSFITRDYIASYEDDLQGYICMGTRGSDPMGAIGQVISKSVAKRKGSKYRSERLDKISKHGYNNRFKAEHDEHSWLSKNIENRRSFREDDRADFIFTAKGFESLAEMLQSISGRKWARKVNPRLPILVISGGMDPVGSYGKGPREVAGWLKRVGVEDVTLKIYEKDRHELLNELDREDVYQYLLDWIHEKDLKKN